jgi:hypothetical protein
MNAYYRLLAVSLLLMLTAAVVAEEPETADRPLRRNGQRRVSSDQRSDRFGGSNAITQDEYRPRRPKGSDRRGAFRRADGSGRDAVKREGTGPRRPGRNRVAGQREHVQNAMDWLKQNNPEEFNRLTQLKEENPRALRREISKVLQDYAKEKHPVQYKRMTQNRAHMKKMRELRQQYRSETDPQKRAEIEQEMRTVLADAFDKKQAARKQELEKLEERIKQFRETLKKNSEKKQATIDARLKDWTQEADPEE